MLERFKDKLHRVLHVARTYTDFYRHACPPIYDTDTDTSQNTGTIKNLAYYVGCEDGRSDRYRVYNLVSALKERGIRTDVYKLRSLPFLLKNTDYDVVVIFREDRYRRIHMEKILSTLKKRKIPVIYDTDDFTIENKSLHTTKNIIKIINRCAATTVTTKFLAELFEKSTGKTCYVIKNTINEKQVYVAEKTTVKKDKGKIKIVYMSGTNTHNRDFEQAEEGVLYALEKYPDVEFHIFGPLNLSWKFAPYEGRIFRYPYMDYLKLQVQVSEMDINIAPLVLNDFNNSKSELKIFESALLKIPTVCSPTEPYAEIIKNRENGYIASTPDKWKAAFKELIENESKRLSVGEAAYRDFVPKFRVNEEVKNVIKIYEEISAKSER